MFKATITHSSVNASHWRMRAGETRTLAARLAAGGAQNAILDIAASYDATAAKIDKTAKILAGIRS